MPGLLTAAQLARDLALTDLTDPSDGPHAIQLLVEAAVTALTSAWSCEARWCRGPRTVTIADNYDHLGYQPAAVTRAALRDRICAAIHQGTRHQWAIPPRRADRAGQAAGAGT